MSVGVLMELHLRRTGVVPGKFGERGFCVVQVEHFQSICRPSMVLEPLQHPPRGNFHGLVLGPHGGAQDLPVRRIQGILAQQLLGAGFANRHGNFFSCTLQSFQVYVLKRFGRSTEFARACGARFQFGGKGHGLSNSFKGTVGCLLMLRNVHEHLPGKQKGRPLRDGPPKPQRDLFTATPSESDADLPQKPHEPCRLLWPSGANPWGIRCDRLRFPPSELQQLDPPR